MMGNKDDRFCGRVKTNNLEPLWSCLYSPAFKLMVAVMWSGLSVFFLTEKDNSSQSRVLVAYDKPN